MFVFVLCILDDVSSATKNDKDEHIRANIELSMQSVHHCSHHAMTSKRVAGNQLISQYENALSGKHVVLKVECCVGNN